MKFYENEKNMPLTCLLLVYNTRPTLRHLSVPFGGGPGHQKPLPCTGSRRGCQATTPLASQRKEAPSSFDEHVAVTGNRD